MQELRQNSEDKQRGWLGVIAGMLIILSIFMPVRLNPYDLPNSEEVGLPLAVKVLTGQDSVFKKIIALSSLSIGISITLLALLRRWKDHQLIWIGRALLGVLSIAFYLFIFYFVHETNDVEIHDWFAAGTVVYGPYWTGPAVYMGLLGSMLSIIALRRRPKSR
jgi:hypothetical protein